MSTGPPAGHRAAPQVICSSHSPLAGLTMRLRVILGFLSACALAGAAPSFSRDIRPILQKRCQGCHQPASKASDLDVTTFEAFAKGGKRGPGFVAGTPDESLTLRYISGSVQPRMPLGQPELPANEVALLKEWILDGAKNDETAAPVTRRESVYLQPPVITALKFSPDGKQIAVSGNGEILIHASDGSRLLHRLPGQAERILSLAYNADGSLLKMVRRSRLAAPTTRCMSLRPRPPRSFIRSATTRTGCWPLCSGLTPSASSPRGAIAPPN
ncbi:MAG: hypothetical protein IPJ98_00735 [Bryobacterales bacterium]|nr:hypothetical protein [Bryobacterales bacterium]